jgi:tetratricopeptide (TPR) repeat protein
MGPRTASFLIALVVAGRGFSALAGGQAPENRPASAGGLDERAVRARQLFREGSQLYDEARYEEAAARFEEAYRLSLLPALLFNIAQAYRLGGPGRCATALSYYERYLHDDPTASNRQEIEELILGMRSCADATPAPPAPRLPGSMEPPSPAAVVAAPAPSVATAPAASPRSAGSRWRWGAIAGGATLLVGAGAYSAALVKYYSVKDRAPFARGTFRDWELVTDTSYVLMAAGATTTLVSVIFVLEHRSHVPVAGIDVSLVPGPALRLYGRF